LPLISVTRLVAAEIDWSQIGVGRDDSDVERIDAQHFGDDIAENRVGSLADIDRAAEHHATARSHFSAPECGMLFQ
jgi:hypothetical protein